MGLMDTIRQALLGAGYSEEQLDAATQTSSEQATETPASGTTDVATAVPTETTTTPAVQQTVASTSEPTTEQPRNEQGQFVAAQLDADGVRVGDSPIIIMQTAAPTVAEQPAGLVPKTELTTDDILMMGREGVIQAMQDPNQAKLFDGWLAKEMNDRIQGRISISN